MEQLFLFTGENDFALRQERDRWVRAFTEKHGIENLSRVSGAKIRIQSLLDEVSAAPFIAERRLILVDGVPELEKEEMQMLLDAIHPNVILAFIDPSPDRRLSSVKLLMKHAQVKSFPPLSRPRLLSWIGSFLAALGATIEQDAVSHLLQAVGADQQLLAQEIRKLALFAGERPISRRDIDLLVVCSAEQARWRLTDYIAEGRHNEALSFARELMERGESPSAIWNTLLWMLSQLVLVAAAVEEGQSSPEAITKSMGVKPGTVRAFVPLARRTNVKALGVFVRQLAHIDMEMKTGVFRSSAESPEELEALIDVTISALARLAAPGVVKHAGARASPGASVER